MKRFAITLAALALLTGCAGLNVSWSVSASYNTNASTHTQTMHLTSPANEK